MYYSYELMLKPAKSVVYNKKVRPSIRIVKIDESEVDSLLNKPYSKASGLIVQSYRKL